MLRDPSLHATRTTAQGGPGGPLQFDAPAIG
jgi:hypothetical protein